jgi:hypothetical protein
MIHLIQVDRDGVMAFACDEIELFTTQGATRDVFRELAKLMPASLHGQQCCPYCARLLAQGNVKNSRVPK